MVPIDLWGREESGVNLSIPLRPEGADILNECLHLVCLLWHTYMKFMKSISCMFKCCGVVIKTIT